MLNPSRKPIPHKSKSRSPISHTIKTDNDKIMHAIMRKYKAQKEVNRTIEQLHVEFEICDPNDN